LLRADGAAQLSAMRSISVALRALAVRRFVLHLRSAGDLPIECSRLVVEAAR
jgi:hypothetical protein